MKPTQTPPTPNKPSPEELLKPQSVLSAEQLIKLAEQAYDQFSPGIAAKYYQDAIQQQPNNALLYHKLALMYVEHGDPEEAHKCFLKSIELSPDENGSNYLYIGQQCYGMAAKSAFEKGIDLMQKRLITLKTDNNDGNDGNDDEKLVINNKEKEINDLKTEISSVYVSIAELFMTDLCEEEDAQIQCEKYLNLSLAEDINNIETYATFGQFRHCQQNDIDATKYFGISLQKLFQCKSNNNNNNNNGDNDNNNDDNKDIDAHKLDIFGDKSLSIDSFLKIVKLGIELEQYQQSLRVLKGLINANDGIGEFWALGAFCFYKLEQKQDAAIWLNNAESILSTESSSGLNFELNDTLQAIKSEMNINELPDISKLKLDDDGDINDGKENDNGDNDDIDNFLEDEEDDDDDDDDDVDLEQDEINNNDMDEDEDDDIDLNNNDMIDID